MRSLKKDDILLVGIMVIWGFNYVAIKLALREVQPLVFVTLRNCISLLVLIGIVLMVERQLTFRRADLGRLLLIGFAGVTINQLAFNVGMKYTSAANASILITTSTIFGLLFGMAFERERVSRRRWMGVVAAMVGVSFIIAGGQAQLHFGFENIVGDLLILAGAASWALYSVLGRPILKIYSPLQLTFFGSLIGVPLIIPVTAGTVIAQQWSDVSGLGWTMIFYAGVLSSVTGVFWYRAVAKSGASRALIFMYLVPLFAVISAVLVLHETLSAMQLVGAVVALAGVNVARQG